MLGKEHVSISLATIFPFIVPMIFLGIGDYPLYSFSLLFGVVIGSLTPDADCGGKPKLYYDFKLVYDIMIPLQKTVIFIFNNFNLKHKLDLEYEVKNEHRGIMHAPIGILISSLVLTLLAVIFAFVFLKGLNLIILLLFVFAGLLFGQFLHLLEDSCTIAGINWKFPFGTKEMKGKIYTFSKIEGKKDIRPSVYQYSLWMVTIFLLIGSSFGFIDFSHWTIYPLIILLVAFVWVLIIITSKTDYGFWYQDIEKIKKIKKAARDFSK